MRRYFIQLAYKGTDYHGWQVQKNTVRTVQQVMQEKLSLLLHEKIELYGCGRTDTGVHAQDFYASFDSEKDDLHDEKYHWLYKMNRCLPDDISVYGIIPVTPEANARFSAVARTYKYYIHTVPNPFSVDTSWFLYGDLDLDLMNRAAEKIKATKDFGSFVKSNNNHNNYICKIHEAVWTKEGNNLVFTVRANRFLRNMVRALVGTMVDIGSGKTKLEELDGIINSSNRSQAGTSVPARGLHLVKIEYKKEIFQ
ncbi:MAG: tRNA pseudouridine(38-40) synthase TruA [Bacteroidia bacterium]